ncbi:Translation initiation factor IF-2, mitochondrial [Plasmodiophora brassicae]
MLHAGRRWLSSKPASILDRVREALRLRQQGIVPNRPGAVPPNPAAEPATTPPAAPSKLREQLKNMSIAPAPARAQGPATAPPPSVHDDKVKRFMEKLAGRPAHTPRSHLPRPVPDRGDDERDQRKKRKKTLIEQRRRRMILTEGDKLSVREFSQLLGISMPAVAGALRRLGEDIPWRGFADVLVATETVQVAAMELQVFVEKSFAKDAEAQTRPVVVSVVGHVDHGKTTLLDTLRDTRIAQSEVGGITQRIGAFALALTPAISSTFIDTPGHAAFCSMRVNACRITDVVILVVAADSGVQDQTIESIKAIRNEDLPVVVALTKCDLPGADPDSVRRSLMDHGLVSEELGGDVQMVEVSSKTGAGLDDLRESVGLQAEMCEPQAIFSGPARAVVIESQIVRGLGPSVTAIVRRGTLDVGNVIVCGEHMGVVKALHDDLGKKVRSATPAQAVAIMGMKTVPSPGTELVVVDNEQRAKRIVAQRVALREQQDLKNSALWEAPASEQSTASGQPNAAPHEPMRMIIRAESSGSVDALLGFINRIPQKHVQLAVLLSGVGPITEADVKLAQESGATVFGFGVNPQGPAKKLATTAGVQVRTERIIYKIMDLIVAAINERMPLKSTVETTGRAHVLAIFDLHGARGRITSRAAGSRIVHGKFEKSSRVRVFRNNNVIWEGSVFTLRHFKDEVPAVEKGSECGIVLDGFNDFVQGDIIECFRATEERETISVDDTLKRTAEWRYEM